MKTIKLKWKILLAFLTIVGAAAGYWHWRSFPGYFVLARFSYMYKINSYGIDELRSGINSQKTKLAPFKAPQIDTNGICQLTVSRNGKSAAYVIEHGGVITYFVVRPITGVVRQTTTSDGVKMEFQPLRYVEVSRHRIPMSARGNLEWSPDCRRLAYATNDVLYIIDIGHNTVKSAQLPRDKELDSLYDYWQDYDSASSAEVEDYHKHHGPLPKPVSNALCHNDALLRSRLGLSPRLHFRHHTWWTEIYDLNFLQGKRHRIFNYAGRTLAWVSSDTLYCDNWKLKLFYDGKGRLVVSPKKTALVSGIIAHPCWSPKGDKAAYLVNAYFPGRQNKYGGIQIVVVDASGKVLWQQESESEEARPRWSQDGRFLAILNYPIGNDGMLQDEKYGFFIYEVGKSRYWFAPVKWDVNRPSTRYYPVSGWDWHH